MYGIRFSCLRAGKPKALSTEDNRCRWLFQIVLKRLIPKRDNMPETENFLLDYFSPALCLAVLCVFARHRAGLICVKGNGLVLPNRQVIDQQRKEASKSIKNLPFMHVINITIIVSNIKVSLYSRINVFLV